MASCAAVCVLVNIAGDNGDKETQFFPTIITIHSTVRRYCSYSPIMTVVKRTVEKKCKFPVINLLRGDVIAST